MKTRMHPRQPSPLLRVVHGFLLLGWLLSSHGIAPALCVAAARMDGDHAVSVGASVDGGTTVVLAHRLSGSDGQKPHEHDALCTLLMVFALSSPSGESDHILAFKSVEDASRVECGEMAVHPMSLGAPPPVCVVLSKSLVPACSGIKTRAQPPAWFPGLAMKAGRTIMLC